MTVKNYLTITFCTLLALIGLASCGFKLQTGTALASLNIPPQLKSLYLTGDQPYSSFMNTLRQDLKERDITVLQNPTAKTFTLNVTNAGLNTTLASISTTQQASQYNLTYNATFVLVAPDGKTVTGPFTLSATSVQTLPPNQMTQTSSQIVTTSEVLQEQIINQLFFRLGASDTTSAVGAYDSSTSSSH
ncbi:MAG: hypothetical protein A3E87_11085 [Gammaproteobacteria bacterium RIFCSPHIGHO2_12_FULL_35_23]|nr:MAG: hypothetical protein A3E87_11085 [Gammaproteobacteria bacterium RIFCSPHIGHO2_12_FULL_35_23]